MKKLFLTLAFIPQTLMSYAQYGTPTQTTNNDGDNLYVYTKDASSAVVYSLDNLDKLTFGNNAISIWTFGSRMDYQYSRITLMTFCEDIKPTTTSESLIIGDTNVKITYDRSSSLVNVVGGRTLRGVTIYDVQGRLVTKDARKLSSYQVSLQGKPQGVYVIRVDENGKSTTMRIVK